MSLLTSLNCSPRVPASKPSTSLRESFARAVAGSELSSRNPLECEPFHGCEVSKLCELVKATMSCS